MTYRLDITGRLHRRMLEIVGTALPLMTGSRADADLIGLAHLREEMVEAIDAYCRHVQTLREAGHAPSAPGAALDDGCTSLRSAYDTFRARWVHREALENWHEYRLSAVVMMKQVRTLVQQAEAHASGRPEAGLRARGI